MCVSMYDDELNSNHVYLQLGKHIHTHNNNNNQFNKETHTYIPLAVLVSMLMNFDANPCILITS